MTTPDHTSSPAPSSPAPVSSAPSSAASSSAAAGSVAASAAPDPGIAARDTAMQRAHDASERADLATTRAAHQVPDQASVSDASITEAVTWHVDPVLAARDVSMARLHERADTALDARDAARDQADTITTGITTGGATTTDTAEFVSTAEDSFNAWDEAYGDDLVVGGVAYDADEWTYDPEDGVRRLTADERAADAEWRRVCAEHDAAQAHEAATQDRDGVRADTGAGGGSDSREPPSTQVEQQHTAGPDAMTTAHVAVARAATAASTAHTHAVEAKRVRTLSSPSAEATHTTSATASSVTASNAASRGADGPELSR